MVLGGHAGGICSVFKLNLHAERSRATATTYKSHSAAGNACRPRHFVSCIACVGYCICHIPPCAGIVETGRYPWHSPDVA